MTKMFEPVNEQNTEPTWVSCDVCGKQIEITTITTATGRLNPDLKMYTMTMVTTIDVTEPLAHDQTHKEN